jgi:hypothetical protein
MQPLLLLHFMHNRLHFRYVHCITTNSRIGWLSPALLHIYNAFAPCLCREETVLYKINMLHGIPPNACPSIIQTMTYSSSLLSSQLAIVVRQRSLSCQWYATASSRQKLVPADFGTVGQTYPLFFTISVGSFFH